MTELTEDQLDILLIIQVDTTIKYKDESYKIIKKSKTMFAIFIYIQKIPDDGKKYNLCILIKNKTLAFHVLGYYNIPISYSDIEIL